MSKVTLGAIAVLVLLLGAAGVTIKNLYESVGELQQANDQLKITLEDSERENAELVDEMGRRDRAVLNAKRARDRAESDAAAIRQARDEALKDDPWIHDDVPAAVVNSLQAGARPDAN